MGRIQRNDYTLSGPNPTKRADSEFDFDNYFDPRAQAVLSTCVTSGVAGGFAVSTAPGDPTKLVVSSGVAIDSAGKLVDLPPDGVALFDKNSNPPVPDIASQQQLVNSVLSVPVPAATDGIRYLTVQYFDFKSGQNPAVLIQAPWVRLQSDLPDQTSKVVVLATITITDGRVTGLSGDDRHILGVHGSTIEVRGPRTDASAQTVDTSVVATLAGRADGGMELSLLRPGSSTVTAMAVDPTGDVHLGGGAGRIAIGDSGRPPQRTLDVTGGVHAGGADAELSFADQGSDAFVDDPDQGQRWRWYADQGAARLWSGTDRLTVDPSLPGGGLDVARPMRVRQGGDVGAGVWLHQDQPSQDSAFVGMADDEHVGIRGASADSWGLTMHTGTALVESGGKADLTSVTPQLFVHNDNANPPPFPISAAIACDVINGTALHAKSTKGTGIYAFGKQFAAELEGNVHVTGNLVVDGTVSKNLVGFRIDHPQAPAEKYLRHSAVESDEMKNVYDGEVLTDIDGGARIDLPSWFESLNHRYRYQLTPVGAPAPNLHVARELHDGHFTIAGAPPRTRVCWMITGVRQDAYARANPIEVEGDKASAERGRYIHPELHGAPAAAKIRPAGSVAAAVHHAAPDDVTVN